MSPPERAGITATMVPGFMRSEGLKELAVNERRHSEHHDVHFRHNAPNIGGLLRQGLQLLAIV